MKPICLSKQIRKEKIYDSGHLLFTRDCKNNLRVIPTECPHLGLDLNCAKVQDKLYICPYHNWSFKSNLAGDLNIFEYQGVVWDYNQGNLQNTILTKNLLEKVIPNNWRKFKIQANYKHVLANLVDYAHFGVVHGNSPGFGLNNYQVKERSENTIEITWKTSLPRPSTSEVTWRDYCVASKVPFFEDYLTAINLVIPVEENVSILLVNFFFDSKYHQENPWLRFWTNRMVDVLVWEDSKILRKIKTLKPKLEKETNPLIYKIYEVNQNV